MDTKEILKTSYLNQKEAANKLKDLGYNYDKNLSTNESKVFVDPFGKPHILFRGSKRLSDFVVDDALIASGFGKYSRRVNEAKDLTKKVEEKYNKPVDVYGHSLGGYLAEHSGAKGGITTYNKLMAPEDIGRTISKRQVDIRTVNDFPSALSVTQKHKGDYVILPNKHNNIIKTHSLSQLD